jgi:UMF1 family MFS transporter
MGYDWANSAQVTVVTSALGGPYLDALARSSGTLSVAGLRITPGLVLPGTLVLAVLVQVVLLPVLGRSVDRGHSPANLIRRLALLGGSATVLFALAPGWSVAALAMAAASVCFGAAMVPYNALLPRLAPGTAADKLSARAFATGYVGGGLLLAASLVLLTAAPFGLGQGTLVRSAIAAAGIWWAGFALLACRAMRDSPSAPARTEGSRAGTVRLLRDLPELRWAVLGALLLGDAIGAVVALSATVLTFELWTSRGLPAADATPTLLTIVLLLQVLAAPAAVLCGWAAKRLGAKPVLLICMAGWVALLVGALFGLHEVRDAYVLAVGIALVLGGSQTLARSLVSQCTPAGSAGAVFAVTELASRGTAWIGPTVFGVVVATTGSYRGALASLALLFAVAAVALSRVRPAQGVQDAAAYDPALAYEARRIALPDAQVPTRVGIAAYAVVAGALGVLLRTTCRIRLVSRPALPSGGVVVVANHRSVLDGPLLAVVGRGAGRQLRMLGTAGVFTAPVLGRLLLAAGMVPVKRRSEHARAALAGAERLLQAGEAVALFPEGRINSSPDGLPQPLRSGAARLALSTGVPVVAVGITGAEHVIRPGTWRPALRLWGRRHRVDVRMSSPVVLHEALGLTGPVPDPDDQLLAAATSLLHDLLTAQVTAAPRETRTLVRTA